MNFMVCGFCPSKAVIKVVCLVKNFNTLTRNLDFCLEAMVCIPEEFSIQEWHDQNLVVGAYEV